MTWYKGLVVLLCVSYTLQERVRYDGYHVFEVVPETEAQLEILQKMHERADDSFMFSVPPHHVGRGVEIAVPPGKIVDQIQRLFDLHKVPFTITEDNLQGFLDVEIERITQREEYDPNDYNTWDLIISELNRLAGECPSGFECNVRSIGQSYEGREIDLLTITRPGENRQILWMDSLIHSREWLAGATLMRITAQLIEEYENDEEARRLLDNYDIYIMPVVNPDGYEFTFTNQRFWRKNRAINSGSSCVGVDLNRNFPYAFGGPGAVDDPCNDLFAGPEPLSEPETAQYAAEVTSHSNIIALVSIHTFDWSWLLPYGSEDENGNCERDEDYDDLHQMGDAIIAAIKANGGADRWISGTVCEALYTASGITVDWAKRVAGIKYPSTPELRGPFFNPGPGNIEPSFIENYAGIIAMMKEIEIIEAGKK